MDIFDKNSKPFVPYGDREFIPKLKRIDAALNKLISEVIVVQGVNGEISSNISEAMEFLIENALTTRFASGAGIFLANDEVPGEVTLSVSTQTFESLGLAGTFLVLGGRQSTQTIQVSAGNLPAISPMFNFATGQIETIYQRYRVLNSSDSELTSLCAFAIDGAFCISGEVEDFSSGRNIAITPYNYDAGIDLEAAWQSNCTLKDGVGLNLIDVGVGYIVKGVVMIKPGKFVILTSHSGSITTYNVKIVTYTSPLSFTVDTIGCSIASAGVTGCDFNSASQMISVDIDTFEIAVSINIQNTTTFQEGSIIFTINTETNIVTDYLVDLDTPNACALAGLAAINERCFDMELMYFYYRNCRASFGGIKLASSTQSYGATIEYQTYTSRTIAVNGTAAYTDLSGAFTQIDSVPLMGAKITAIGYPFDDPGYHPTFGAISGYVI